MDATWVAAQAARVGGLADDVRRLALAAHGAGDVGWHSPSAAAFREVLAADASALARVAAALDDVVAALDSHARAVGDAAAADGPAAAVAGFALQLTRLLP